MTPVPSARINNPSGLEFATVVEIHTPGPAPDGTERWVIPHEILNGHSIEITPWPPERRTHIMTYAGGRYRRMFTFGPNDLLNWEALREWRWDRHEEEIVTHVEGTPPLSTPMGVIEDADVPDVPDRDWGDERDALINMIQDIDDPIVLWWVRQAIQEASATVAKAREYGSAELEYAGHVIGRIGGREVDKPTALELQIFHYVLGKQGRWVAAVTRNEQVSDDTLLDIGVYVRMVQYIREHGEWT